jgi:lysozyme
MTEATSPRTKVAALALSAVALVGLALSEGYTSTAVQPLPGDKWTYGFGTTEGVKAGDKIAPPQALQRKLADVQKFEGAVKQCVHVPLYQHEYDSYLSLAYNIGTAAFCASTLVRKLNAYAYEEACNEILRWDKYKGLPQAGLTARRKREHRTCLGSD